MNYYEVLEVKETATAEEIRAAYLRLVQQYHPDRHAGQDTADQDRARFKQIQAAYEELHDAHRREQYDRRLSSIPRPRQDRRRAPVATQVVPAVRRDVPNDLLRRGIPRKRKRHRFRRMAFLALITVLAASAVPQCSRLFEADLEETYVPPAEVNRGGTSNLTPLMLSLFDFDEVETDEQRLVKESQAAEEADQSELSKPASTVPLVDDKYWLVGAAEIQIIELDQWLAQQSSQSGVPSPESLEFRASHDAALLRGPTSPTLSFESLNIKSNENTYFDYPVIPMSDATTWSSANSMAQVQDAALGRSLFGNRSELFDAASGPRGLLDPALDDSLVNPKSTAGDQPSTPRGSVMDAGSRSPVWMQRSHSLGLPETFAR